MPNRNIRLLVDTEPLLEYMNHTYPEETYRECGARLGIARDRYQRLTSREKMSYWNADRFAVHLGLHPSLIWVNWFEIGN
jgi:hypothetical protein